MVKVTKCCVIFPLRPGCVALGVVFAVLALMGVMNKLIEITLFMKALQRSETNMMESFDDTRTQYKIQATIIRFFFVMLVELAICFSSMAFVYGLLKERLRMMPPFIIHLSLKVGFYAVHYFDLGTKHIERNDTTGAFRLYTFGIILCCTFSYLWLCAYSAFLELKEQKDTRAQRLERERILEIEHFM